MSEAEEVRGRFPPASCEILSRRDGKLSPARMYGRPRAAGGRGPAQGARRRTPSVRRTPPVLWRLWARPPSPLRGGKNRESEGSIRAIPYLRRERLGRAREGERRPVAKPGGPPLAQELAGSVPGPLL